MAPDAAPAHGDGQVEAQTDRERQEHDAHHRHGEVMEARGIASALHDPVPRRRQEERPEREEQCEQGAQLQRSLGGAELLVALLEERPILEAEQHLRSQDQDAGLVQGVLHLAMQGHTEMCGARTAVANGRPVVW